VLAFALQVLYDGLGAFPNKITRKFWAGVFMLGILAFFLVVFLFLNFVI
jgi:hypothetical protein